MRNVGVVLVLALGLGLYAGCNKSPPLAREKAPAPGASLEVTGASLASDAAEGATPGRRLATSAAIGSLETVALFDGAMPTGVTVSQSGRVFVNFPRWGDDVAFTVAEVKDGKAAPYPDAEVNRVPAPGHLEGGFVSVQSVVVDPADRLWVLDTGAIKMGKTDLGGPKLVGIDLATNKIVKTIVLPRTVALETSYVNDVRFDLTRGGGGIAYITDSSAGGPNGLIVVDLESGRSWRRLHDHPSTKADKSFLPIVEGQQLLQREPGQAPKPFAIGSDGIALSGDGKTLYYCPLSSRRLYSVSADALAGEATANAAVARTVEDLGEKGASDGLESDAEGRLYVTSYEGNAILRRNVDGTFETLVADPRALWPDTLSLASDGYLYFIANQLSRQPQFHEGRDLRQKPYVLFRVKVDGTRVMRRN